MPPCQPLDTDLETCVRRLPKAELHFHFEGAFRWSTIRELHPYGKALPARPPWLERARPFADFEDFSQVFRDYMRPVTGTPESIERHAFEMLTDLAQQNVRYVEILLTQQFHTRLGLSEEEVWRAAVAGCRRAMAQCDIDARLFLGLSRHQSPAQALQVLEEIAAFALPRGWISGIDLQSDERRGDNRAFVTLYQHAASLNLKLRAHAGEICGAQNVRDAVFLCGVKDISHGVRAIEDAGLVQELASAGVYLHLCPTSNLLLAVARDHASHPLRALCDAGVRCTVNSDDPLLFGTNITEEYRVLLREMGFSLPEVGALAKNAIAASLLDPARRATLCAEIDRVVA